MIGLVACCGKKLDKPAEAQKLYRSSLFKKSVAWVQPQVTEWAILSAKLGLVMPDDVIEPYDVTLNNMSKEQRIRWAMKVRKQLREKWPEQTFLVLAGLEYRRAVIGLPHEVPMAGLGIGKQLRFLTQTRKKTT